MEEQKVEDGEEASHAHEAVGYVEDGEIDELKIEEIHHALADDAVDLIADTAARDHGEGDADGGGEGLARFCLSAHCLACPRPLTLQLGSLLGAASTCPRTELQQLLPHATPPHTPRQSRRLLPQGS